VLSGHGCVNPERYAHRPVSIFELSLRPPNRVCAGEAARFPRDAGRAPDGVLRDAASPSFRDGSSWRQLVVNDTKVISAQLKGRRIGREPNQRKRRH